MILGKNRLLQPEQVELLHRPGPGNSRAHRPALIGIDHQRRMGADGLPHRPQPFDVLLRPLPPHFDFDAPIVLADIVLHFVHQFLGGIGQVNAAAIGGNPFPVAAQQAEQRLPGGLAGQIPQGNVQRGQGNGGKAGHSDVGKDAAPQLIPQPFNVRRIFPQQARPQQGVNGGFHPPAAVAMAVSPANALQPVIGDDAAQQQAGRFNLRAGIGQPGLPGYPV